MVRLHCRLLIRLMAVCLALIPTSRLTADLVELYDVTAGTLPGNQGWLAVVPAPATEQHNGSWLNLDTTAERSSQAGYFSESPFNGASQHPDMPVLDRLTGFHIDFQLQVLSEGHNQRDDNGDGLDDRAGFSLIAISEDLLGLEVGFFEDRVWVYAAAGEGTNSLFTQAEGVAWDTTQMHDYRLTLLGGNYLLSANGSSLLTGSLRNYNPSGVNPLFNPYDNPSFLFLGDDTTSADSNVLLGSISVSAIPEPSGVLILTLILGRVAVRRKSRARPNARCADPIPANPIG